METIVKQRLEEFLTKNITPKELAKSLRRFEHETIKMVLNAESEDIYCKDWIADGHYFLTELCEILDPKLEDTATEDK